MRILYSIVIFLLIGMNSLAWGEERVAETLENVDFIIENLRDGEGNIYGESYYAKNNNDYPMRISMELVQAENVDPKIIPYTVIMEPEVRILLGSVVKNDSEKDAVWKYQWEVEPDLHDLNVEKLEMCSKYL